MAERRSVTDAMVPPSVEAFIKSGVAAPQPVKTAVPPDGPDEDIIDLDSERPARTSGRGRPRRSQGTPDRQRESSSGDRAASVLSEMLVPLTTKLRRQTAQALKRAYLEQKLRDATPSTQQEIVEEAVGEWLSRHGFEVG